MVRYRRALIACAVLGAGVAAVWSLLMLIAPGTFPVGTAPGYPLGLGLLAVLLLPDRRRRRRAGGDGSGE